MLIPGAVKPSDLLRKDFAAKGPKLVIHYNSGSSKSEVAKTLANMHTVGEEDVLVQTDLTKVKNITKLFDAAIEKFGGLDIAINTVGKVKKKPFVDTTESEHDSMSDINSKVAYFFIHEAWKKLNDNGKIRTIVTSLLAAYKGLYSTYEGMKVPVEHFTRAAPPKSLEVVRFQ